MPLCGELLTPPEHELPPRMNGLAFYQRRFARTVPLCVPCPSPPPLFPFAFSPTYSVR